MKAIAIFFFPNSYTWVSGIILIVLLNSYSYDNDLPWLNSPRTDMPFDSVFLTCLPATTEVNQNCTLIPFTNTKIFSNGMTIKKWDWIYPVCGKKRFRIITGKIYFIRNGQQNSKLILAFKLDASHVSSLTQEVKLSEVGALS